MSHRDHPPLKSLLEHRPWVRAVARRLLRDEHAAEDLAQEAWTRALRSPPDPVRDPRPWLRRVLKNAASNMRRGEARRAQRETAWREQREQQSPEALVSEAEQHKRLVNHVLDLEEPFKTALVLRFYEGLGPQEIGARLAVPVGTVHSRIARAVERLKVRLDDEAEGDRKVWMAALFPLAEVERFAPVTATAAAGTSFIGILSMTLTKPNLALLTLLLLGTFVGVAFWYAPESDGKPARGADMLEHAHRADPQLQTRGAALQTEATPASPASTAPASTVDSALVRGYVRDATGALVEGAEVRVLPGTSHGLYDAEDSDPLVQPVRTAVDGSFQIDTPGVVNPRLIVFADGHMPLSVSLAAASLKDPLDLKLGAPWRLTVRVEDERGVWPADSSVDLVDALDGGFERAVDAKRQEFWGELEASTEDGPSERVIEMGTEAPMKLTLWPARGMAAVPPALTVEYPAPEASFRLVRSAHLILTLRDESGKALSETARASVWVGDRKTRQTAWSIGGRIRDYGMDSRLAPGTYDIDVQSTGHEPWWGTFTVHEPGERHEIEVRLKPASGRRAYGRLLLRPVPGATASKAVLALAADDGGRPFMEGIGQHVVLMRRTDGDLAAWRKDWRGDWADTSSTVLEDGRLDMELARFSLKEASVPAGTYDICVTERATGRAGLVLGVRIFGDQTNEIDVRLEPGTMVRLPDLVARDGAWTGVRVRAGELGELPIVAFNRSGHGTFTDPVGVRYLTNAPLRDIVLGPFPAAEVEVSVMSKEGAPKVIKVRASSASKPAGR